MSVSPKDIEVFFEYFGFFVVHVAGLILATHALIKVRTSQGAIAWMLALVTIPYISIPFYFVFGRRRLYGYIQALRRNKGDAKKYYKYLEALTINPSDGHPFQGALCKISDMPATRGNATRILCDGEETFTRIFEVIESARSYVLVQFYIIRDDEIGRKLQKLLMRKAKEGVKVYVIYDDVGSHSLPRKYIRTLQTNGVEIHSFRSTFFRTNRFQINFRNHRKIVVVDGEHAFLGGLNVGDEYLGKDPYLGYWRDTHIEIQGPAVTCVQLAFLEDWLWVANVIPKLNFRASPRPEDEEVLILPTGPADENESCGLFFVEMINLAKSRLWIASPYFVPDLAVITALILAAMRGVDVRILVPNKIDHVLVYYASQYYLELLSRFGIKLYEYHRGFMHQKTLLVDEHLSVVGSANLDNRSFRLNFEIVATIAGEGSNSKLAQILETDFSQAEKLHPAHWVNRRFSFRLMTRFARLFAPVL